MEMIINSLKYGEFKIIIDDEDYPRVISYNWTIRKIDGQYYLRGRTKDKERKGFNMPNIILGKFNGRIVYKDGDKFNNKKDNLIHIPDNEYIQCVDHYKIITNSLKLGTHCILIDTCDLDLVSKHEWHISKQGRRYYAYANSNINGRRMISMHRLIMGFPGGLEVDHQDNNGINNRRDNLRLATHEQNNMNKGLQVSNTTGFKGVHFFKRDQNYQVYIDVNKKRIHGGYFDHILDAAKKYNELAIKYHGPFAKLNIIPND